MDLNVFLLQLLAGLCLFISSVESVGTGKVVIGKTPAQLVAEGLTANPSLYTVSKNQATGTLPIYIVIIPDGTAYDSNVHIHCEMVPALGVDGYTRITFTSPALTLAAAGGTTSGVVSYSMNNDGDGRPIEIQCYGLSQGGANPRQFTLANSISARVQVQVTNSATVNFCSDQVIVPNIFNITTASFQLELSEAVEVNNVTVSCTTNTAAGGFLNIAIPNQVAVINTTLVSMSYTITTAAGTDVTVTCNAQSQNGGLQFVTASSQDQALFTEDVAAIKFFPSGLKVMDTVFETILALDAPLPSSAQDVNFACTANFVTSQAEVTTVLNTYVCIEVVDTTGTVATNSTTDVPAPQPEWIISNPNPVFKPGETQHSIRVERNLPVDVFTQESILLVCCAPNTINQSPKYINEITHALISSEINPTVPVNFTTSTDASLVQETVVDNLAYFNTPQCPCDLLTDECDVGCCCDVNCTSNYTQLFDCIPGIPGGAAQNSYKDASCLADPFPKPDWHKLLCVFSEENTLLGSSYPTTATIKTNNLFVAKELTAPKKENFAETETRTMQENVNTTLGYTGGISIKTQGQNGMSGVLSLPKKVFDGKCERNSPVRFLTDSFSDCVVLMTEAECKNGAGIFSAKTYMQDARAKTPSCPDVMGVSSGPGVGTPNAPVSANYLCTTDPAPYLFDKAPDAAVTSSFASFDPTLLENCDYNEFGVFDCFPAPAAPTTATIPRCIFDNGETLPPVPVWDATNRVCRDVVLDVHYKFHWAGTSIQSVTADVVLGAVPVLGTYTEDVNVIETVVNPVSGAKSSQTSTTQVQRTYPTEVNQKFRVEFVQANPPNKASNNDVLSELSGNPGYLAYYPIIGAVSTATNGTWDADKRYWPRYFVPNAESFECTEIDKEFVKFDEAVSGTCLLYLNIADFSDCNLLRRYILSILDTTMPMEYLSMVGNPSLTEPSHWIKIDRQNVSALLENLTDSDPSTSRMSLSKSRCDNIPLGVHMEIMFADAGKLEDKFINRIVNAKINYQLSTIELRCSGVNAVNCVPNSASLQPFSFYSSTQYIVVRSQLYSMSRYEQFHSQCVQEFCKEEAMFPFTGMFQGGTYEESLLWMIAIIGVALFIFMITRPWW